FHGGISSSCEFHISEESHFHVSNVIASSPFYHKGSLQEKAAVLISSFLKRIGEPKVCAD
ncbi:hypothetical protein CMV_030227, partial [Castanea mollissima]